MNSTPIASRSGPCPGAAVGLGLVILCIEGYDLFILGAVGPSLLAHPDWEVTKSTLGLLSALAGDLTLFAATRFLTGMGIGALIPLVTAYVSDAAPPRPALPARRHRHDRPRHRRRGANPASRVGLPHALPVRRHSPAARIPWSTAWCPREPSRH